MRLLELRTPGVTVELHPRLAVVYAPEPARRALVDALTASLRGGHGAAGLVEAHGIILDLDGETLRLLDLDGTVEIVLGAADLPVGLGSRQREAADDAVTEQRELIAERRKQVDVAAGAVATVQAEMREATYERDTVAAQLNESEQMLDDAVASREAAERAVESATEASDEVERSAEADRSYDDLREEDTPGAIAAVAVAQVAEPDGFDEGRLTAEEERANAALEAVRAAEVAVSEARDEVERAARAANPARLEPNDRADLEAARQAVIEAEERADRRFGGAGARRRLDEAKAFERVVLDRLGFDSYSDFLLRSSMGSTDPSAELRLEIARGDLLRAERDLTDARAVAEANPAPVPRAVPVPVPVPQPAETTPAPEQAQHAAIESTSVTRQRELAAEADARLVAATRARDDALSVESAARAAFDQALSAVGDAEAKLVELAVRHDEAEQRLVQARVLAAADRDDSAADARSAPARGAWSTEDGAGAAALLEFDRHLLAWLAARGQHPLADPLPIVLDDVYRDVTAGDLEALLERLDHLADSLHVVYLTDDSPVLAWASALPPDRGGLSMVPGAGPPASE